MRRLCVLLLIVAVSLGAASPGLASTPRDTTCWRTLVHDWYVDGKIDGRYRVSCYRAVLARVPADLTYSTVRTDVSVGLTVGIRRLEERGTAAIGPHTVLPPPATAAPIVVLTASHPSHSVVSIVAAAILILLLIAWCIARWRRTPPPRLRL